MLEVNTVEEETLNVELLLEPVDTDVVALDSLVVELAVEGTVVEPLEMVLEVNPVEEEMLSAELLLEPVDTDVVELDELVLNPLVLDSLLLLDAVVESLEVL